MFRQLNHSRVRGKLNALSELSVKGIDFTGLVEKVNQQAIQIQGLQNQINARPIAYYGNGTANTGTPGWTLASLPNGPGDRTSRKQSLFPSSSTTYRL
jgi:hypothetical protein